MVVVFFLYFCVLFGGSVARDVHFYVGPSGSDANNGSDVRFPLKTIFKAVQFAVSSKYTGSDNLYIELLEGYHDLDDTLLINRHHGKLLTIRSYNGQKVHVTGGRRIPSSSFHSVSDHNILNALPRSARNHNTVNLVLGDHPKDEYNAVYTTGGSLMQVVKYVNLPGLNITDYGTLAQYGFHTFRSAPLEVFHNGRPFRPAQWPNEGFLNIVGVPDGAHGKRVRYNSTRPASWSHTDDLWTYGFWYRGWADRSAKVVSLDTKNMIVTLDSKSSNLIGLKTGHWGESGFHSDGGYFRFINVLSELDQPGEYYLDRNTGNLYVWLPSAASTDVIQVSMVKTCIALGGGSRNVVLSNFIIEACRERGFFVLHARNVHLTNMEVRNTGDYSVYISGDSRGCSVTKSTMHDGDGALYFQGGNRKLLQSSGNILEDCDIYRFARVSVIGKEAVVLSGVGNLARYNTIHDGPTTAIRYMGNDHIMEYNNLHHLCFNVTGCAAIYSDNDWTYRDIKIRYNHIHEVLRTAPGSQVQAIQLNHQVSAAVITNNVFYNNEVHILIDGGRDNFIDNNVLYNATKYSLHVTGRTYGSVSTHLENTLHSVPINGSLWKARYPELADIEMHNKSLPEGNQIHNNLVFNAQKIEFIHGMTDRLHNPIFFNVSDIGYSFGPESHFNPSVGDLRVKCHAATWANKVNFQQVVSPNEVGPRYDVGPSFSKLVHKTIPLSTAHGVCPTYPPASTLPMPSYLPDGSGQSPIYKVFDEGCWLHVSKCTDDPKAVGTYRDMTGERYFHAADNETMCFQRAIEQWKFCGSKRDEGVAVIYGPSGVMTYGGEGCFYAYYGCPKHSGPADGHVVNGTVFRDGFAEQHRNASIIQENCLKRSLDTWRYCGSHPNHPVTMIYMPTGATRTAGAGCWIETNKCPQNPNLDRMFYDAYGATNYHTDDYETACLSRAQDFWTTCGSDSRYPVTAHYRPTTRSSTYP